MQKFPLAFSNAIGHLLQRLPFTLRLAMHQRESILVRRETRTIDITSKLPSEMPFDKVFSVEGARDASIAANYLVK